MTVKAVVPVISFQANINCYNIKCIVLKAANHLCPTSYPSKEHGTVTGACTARIAKINHFEKTNLSHGVIVVFLLIAVKCFTASELLDIVSQVFPHKNVFLIIQLAEK